MFAQSRALGANLGTSFRATFPPAFGPLPGDPPIDLQLDTAQSFGWGGGGAPILVGASPSSAEPSPILVEPHPNLVDSTSIWSCRAQMRPNRADVEQGMPQTWPHRPQLCPKPTGSGGAHTELAETSKSARTHIRGRVFNTMRFTEFQEDTA